MGFFNAMSAIGNINSLLKDFENEVVISQDLVQRDAPPEQLNDCLIVMKRLHQRLIDNFGSSAAARCAMFTIFGDKMQMDGILTYTRNVCYHLYSIIQNS